MIVVGAHYLPFVTLDGVRSFALLGAALVLAGAALGRYGPSVSASGAWLTSELFIVADFAGRGVVLREERDRRTREADSPEPMTIRPCRSERCANGRVATLVREGMCSGDGPG